MVIVKILQNREQNGTRKSSRSEWEIETGMLSR